MEHLIEAGLARMEEYPELLRTFLADLRSKNEKGKKIEPWKEDQLNRFGQVLADNARELKRAFTEGNISKTAWVARNFLELSVWVRYCNLSDENGKNFRLDGARDLIGLFEAFKTLYFEQIKNDLDGMQQATQEMEAIAQNEFGASSLGKKYLRVDKAAGMVGETKFESFNKLFSKYAHPTAWVVASVHYEEYTQFAAMFLLEGTFQANKALEAMRNFVLSFYPAAQTQVP